MLNDEGGRSNADWDWRAAEQSIFTTVVFRTEWAERDASLNGYRWRREARAQLPLAHPAFFSPPSPPVLIRFSVSSLAFWDTPTPTAFSNLLMTKWREWREDGPQTSDWWREDIAASWIDLDNHRSSTLLLANDPFTRIALKFQGIYSDDKTRIAPKPSSVHQIFHADSANRRRLQFWSTLLNCRHLFSGTFCTR
jgi:hypothetical protein